MGRFETIRALLAGHAGGARSFVKTLDDRGLAHLSWSKVSCVESCPYGYYLQYVKRVRRVPEPDYFVKGRLFHAAADRFYRGLQQGRALGPAELELIVKRHESAEARAHLRNAIQVLLDNAFIGWEVLGTETIIVLDLGPGLPPCVGVIDLVLRKGKVFAVVDHKTGRTFWRQDPMQLAIYREHLLREHGPVQVRAFFDAYRWVNDLRRIRTPAHQRTRVGELARDRVPGGVLVEVEYFKVAEGLARTAALLADPAVAVVYEGFIQFQDVLVRPDILVRTPHNRRRLILWGAFTSVNFRDKDVVSRLGRAWAADGGDAEDRAHHPCRYTFSDG